MKKVLGIVAAAFFLLNGPRSGAQTGLLPSRFSPAYGEFFKEAVKEKGLVTAGLATLDRRMRDTRIGLAYSPYMAADGYIHETVHGPVYYPQKQKFFPLDEIVPQGEFRSISRDEAFIDYLLGNNLSSDAVYYLFGTNFHKSDTLSFLKGKSLYTAGALGDAAVNFAAVPSTSPYFEPAVFLGAVCGSYSGDYAHAKELLSRYDGPQQELKHYELAALSLLENDAASYLEHSKYFRRESYAMAPGEKVFDDIYQERFVQKSKSEWLAAGLSAIVPGLGKVYSGAYAEGVSSFLLVGTFTGFAVENWVRNGGGDWRSILFTTIASLLHLGNIYGSYISVSLYNSALENAQNQTIVFNIHLPVRSFFK